MFIFSLWRVVGATCSDRKERGTAASAAAPPPSWPRRFVCNNHAHEIQASKACKRKAKYMAICSVQCTQRHCTALQRASGRKLRPNARGGSSVLAFSLLSCLQSATASRSNVTHRPYTKSGARSRAVTSGRFTSPRRRQACVSEQE